MVINKVQLQHGAATKIQQGASIAAMGAAQGMQAAAQGMQVAAQNLQSAAASMNSGVRAGTLSARTWAAPRLESAADYTTASLAPAISDAVVKTLAPRISAALRTTARQISPPEVKPRSTLRSTLTWTALGASVLAGAGAAGTLAWRRYHAGIDAGTETGTQGTGTRGDARDENVAPSEAPPADEASPTAEQSSSAVPGSTTSAW